MNTIMRDRIVKKFGEKTLRRSALNIRGGAGVFETVLKGKGYHTVLEIGTYKGCSTAEIARYCKKVITIDLRFGKIEQNDDVFDREAFWKALGAKNIELHLVDDDAEKKALVDTLDFDFAFIDGMHDETVKNDFEITKRCGHVLFHDADDNRLRDRKPNASNCVYEFIATLPKKQVEFLDIFALWQG